MITGMGGLGEPIRQFYMGKYPDDSKRAQCIPEDSTFDGLTDEMLMSDSFFDYIGTSSEQVRRRIFERLAELHGMTYEAVNSIFVKGFKEANGVKYRRDWNCDGCIRMYEPKTLALYRSLKEDFQPEMHDCFFAFSDQQLQEGMAKFNLKREQLVSYGGGLIGTKQGIEDFFSQYDEPDRRIKAECAPQEVYFYEYNNHECMISWDGDLEAIKIIIARWGADVARKIKRFNASMSIENIIRKPVKMEGLYFLYNGERMVPQNLWFSDIDNGTTRKGSCHCMYDNALHVVLTPFDAIYNNVDLAGLSASYDGKEIYNFRNE